MALTACILETPDLGPGPELPLGMPSPGLEPVPPEPVRVRFPPTLIGETAYTERVVRNHGTVPIRAAVLAGWREYPYAEGPVRIEPGATRTLRFYHRPDAHSPFEREVPLRVQPEGGEWSTVTLTLHGEALPRCGPCAVQQRDTCVPAPDGTVCASAGPCSDGAVCSGGVCGTPRARAGKPCVTPCGQDAICDGFVCGDRTEEPPQWTWFEPNARYLRVLHSDAAGTLVVSSTGEGIDAFLVGDDGRAVWRRDWPASYPHLLAADGVFVVPGSGSLSAIDASSGETRWTMERWMRAAGHGLVFVNSPIGEGHLLEAIDPESGTIRWEHDLRALAPEGFSDRMVFPKLVFTEQRLFLLFQTPTRGDNPRDSYVVAALEPETGAVRWMRFDEGLPTVPLADAAGSLFLAIGPASAGVLRAYGQGGVPRWEAGLEAWGRRGDQVDEPVVATGEVVLTRLGQAFDATTGEPLYGLPLLEDQVATDDAAFVVLNSGMPIPKLAGIDLTSGARRFERLFPSRLQDAAGGRGAQFAVQGYETAYLCTLDGDGQVLEERRLAPAPDPQRARGLERVGHRWFLEQLESRGDRDGRLLMSWPDER